MSKAENIITSIKVEIDAPASVVWDVLVDLARYPEWNPFTVRAESTLTLGDPVHLYLPNPAVGGEDIHVLEHLVVFAPHQLLAWEQRPTASSNVAARRDQYVGTLGAERSSYQTTDIFLGVDEDQITKDFGPWVQQGFDALALAVKSRAEALFAVQPASASVAPAHDKH